MLPIAQYPSIAPPSIKVSTSYPGADTAQVQVQNNLQQVSNRLPATVQSQGTSVKKSSSGFMSVTVSHKYRCWR